MLHERGQVPYGNDKRLEASCYDEIGRADILVSIIGGRFGSISQQQSPYSISQLELKTAIDTGKQVFIFIERSVYSEYQTYLKNKSLAGIKYSHVDNPLVYQFVEEVLTLPQNNAVTPFDGVSEIIEFLKEQWAGLFQRYLQERERLNEESLVKNLQSTANTLQNLVTYFSETQSNKSDALQDLLLTAHPAFQRLQSLFRVGYRVFFTTLNELSAWLKSGRRFEPVAEEVWDTPSIAEWYRGDAKGYDLLKVYGSLFDSDGRLKGMAPGDWDDSMITLQRVDNAVSPAVPAAVNDDDIPF